MKEKVGILSLGCPRNLVDAEEYLGRLAKKGYPVVDINQADIAILNTCAFIKDAKLESIDAILDLIALKRQGRIKKIIVTGCLAQRYKDVLSKEFPQVDAFIGAVSLDPGNERFAIAPAHYAYLKICESCTNHCSFCVIPRIKGRFSSLKMESLLRKAKALDEQGISELNIIGQDTSSYGLDLYGERKLPELLKRILKATKNISWIRLLYLCPEFKLIDKLLDLMQDDPRVCRYIDLPIQHINARILKLMHRATTKSGIIRIIDRIREKLPDVGIRTSLIVGFPTETDKEFRELLDFVEAVGFERLGVFTYSREEDTPAYGLAPQVSGALKQSRFDQLMRKQQDISRKLNAKWMHGIIDVLIESKEAEGFIGRSRYDAPEVDGLVYIFGKSDLKIGEIVRCKVIDTLEYDLVAEVIK